MFAVCFSFCFHAKFHTTLFPTNKTCASCSLPPPGIYWLLSRCQNGLTKQLIISERASVERKKNKFTEAVAWLLGKKYADQSTLGAWECINLKSWDELYTWDGCGSRRLGRNAGSALGWPRNPCPCLQRCHVCHFSGTFCWWGTTLFWSDCLAKRGLFHPDQCPLFHHMCIPEAILAQHTKIPELG